MSERQLVAKAVIQPRVPEQPLSVLIDRRCPQQLSIQAQIDVLKHVATLDTGALLIVVALLEKVFGLHTINGSLG
jgi:hypothetical protein